MASALAGGPVLHVSPDGNDRWAGTAERPVKTLPEAWARGLKLRQASTETVEIVLKDGVYDIEKTLRVGAQPAGEKGTGPLAVRAEHPGRAVLTGGVPLRPGAFRKLQPGDSRFAELPEAIRGSVYVCPLGRKSPALQGGAVYRNVDRSSLGPAEFCVDGVPQVVARWPNAGEPLAIVGPVVDTRFFAVPAGKEALWRAEPLVRAHGFWGMPWADFEAPLDVRSKPGFAGVGAEAGRFPLKKEGSYFVSNVLGELDSLGEYYVDRAARLLYVALPPGALEKRLEFSVLQEPLVTIEGASQVTLTGLVFQAARRNLVTVTRGREVMFEDCRFVGGGSTALVLEGEGCRVSRTQVVGAGEVGILVRGGDRRTLVSSRNVIEDSTVTGAGRLLYGSRQGIRLELGCGSTVRRCDLTDFPHSAISFSGNDHVIEGNTIARACGLTGDAGAIYTGRNLAFRGNRVSGNRVREILGDGTDAGVHGVYLDDGASGTVVENNIFENINGFGVFINGGRDNIIEGNEFIDTQGALRATNLLAVKASEEKGNSWNVLERLTEGGVDPWSEPWASRYPVLARFPRTWAEIRAGLWLLPEGNVFKGNRGKSAGVWLGERDVGKKGVYSHFKYVEGEKQGATKGTKTE